MNTPVEIYQRMRMRRKSWLAFCLAVGVVAFAYWRYVAPRVRDYDSPEDHFKYGSIGADADAGIPFAIWQVLPIAFPQYLPAPDRFTRLPAAERTSTNGYAQFGFLVEPGHDRPIGFSRRHQLIERIGLNCAACHVGRVRHAESGVDRIVLGMPATTVDLQAYFTFLFRCARDPGFTTDRLMAYVAATTTLDPIERFLLRQAVVPLRDALLARDHQLAFLREVPQFGPGRVDTFNPYKTMMFGFPWDGTVGTADFPSLWNQRPRVGMHLHWDGNNDSVFERNISAALGAGATPCSIDLHRIDRLAQWCGSPHVTAETRATEHEPSPTDLAAERGQPFPHDGELQVPAWPFARRTAQSPPIDGARIYGEQCADCHGTRDNWNGSRLGEVIRITEIGTDPERLQSHTPELATSQATLGTGFWWRLKHFTKRDGYVNGPLDGVWARGPFLHNGSVPTLADLLEPPPSDVELQVLIGGLAGRRPTPEEVREVVARAREKHRRPPLFYRGDTEFDIERVGPRCDRAADGERATFLFDTRVRGNSAAGHLYGMGLPPAEKAALVDYLKTFGTRGER